MPAAQLSFKCTSPNVTAEEVIQQIWKLDGVLSVAKEDTKDGVVSGFVIFENVELAAAARNRADHAEPLITLADVVLNRAPPADHVPRSKTAKKERHSHKAVSLPVADFFTGVASAPPPVNPSTRRDGTVERRRRRGKQPQAPPEVPPPPPPHSRRSALPNRQRERAVIAHVACVQNVAYNATNDMLFHAFKSAGHIIDIKRAERLALIYFTEPGMVTEAIVQMNGKEFHGSQLAVCAGGEVKLPVPPPVPQPMPPPMDALAYPYLLY